MIPRFCVVMPVQSIDMEHILSYRFCILVPYISYLVQKFSFYTLPSYDIFHRYSIYCAVIWLLLSFAVYGYIVWLRVGIIIGLFDFSYTVFQGRWWQTRIKSRKMEFTKPEYHVRGERTKAAVWVPILGDSIYESWRRS